MSSKLTALTELTSITDTTDLVYMVDAPGTTPVSRKTQISTLKRDLFNNVEIQVTATTHGFIAGDVGKPIAKYSAGTYAFAQSDTQEHVETVGIMSAYVDANTFKVVHSGKFTKTSHGYTGPVVFVSPSVAGGLTETVPTTDGQFIKPIAKVIDANTLEIIDYPAIRITSTSNTSSIASNAYEWAGTTTDATQTEIFLNGLTNNRYTVAANSQTGFLFYVSACDSSNNCRTWKIEGGIKRNGSNTTAILGSNLVTGLQNDASTTAWDVNGYADDTNEALTPKVTGAASTTIYWKIIGILTNTSVSSMSSFPYSCRNKIINGNFFPGGWQRGTSLAADGAGITRYLADRWGTFGNGSTIAPSQQVFTVGQTDVPYEPQFYHRCVVVSDSAAASQTQFNQRIENVRTLAGQTATLSFYAKADTSKNIAVLPYQNFGTGGSPSAEVYMTPITFSLTATWQKFTTTFSVPSISGKTIGTTKSGMLAVIWFFDAGSNLNAYTNSLGHQSGTFDIAQVQLEAGSIATPFEQRPYTVELALCQRHCQKIGLTNAYPKIWGYGPSAANISFNFPLPVKMYAPPTITIAGTWAVVNCGQPTTNGISADGFSLKIATTDIAAGVAYAYPNGDDDYILLEAEI